MAYTEPELEGHSVPYKGKRFWVIDVDADHPFEWVDAEVGNYAVYDKTMRCVIATIQVDDDGRFWVKMATQCDSGFLADSLQDAAQCAGRQFANMARNGWG
jgi:hypothetical protein